MEDYLSAKQAMKVGMRGYKDIVNVNWHGVIINIRTIIKRNDVVEMISSILSMCSGEDGSIIPEFVDFAIRVNIILYYTNVELPTDIDELYMFVYFSNLYDVICENANKGQLKSIERIFYH